MALKISMVLAGISIALLAVYGADVAAGLADSSFLVFDEMTRGLGLGGPSLVLPIIAFFISRKEPSSGLGVMIAVAGALIIVGGAAVLGLGTPDPERNPITEAGPLLVIGAFIVALGAIKIKRS